MPQEKELQRLYHLKSNPFSVRVRVDAPIVGRKKEQEAWGSILTSKSGARGCSLNFIIGDYGMGKSHSLYHIKNDCDNKGNLASIIVKLLPEDEIKNFGLDFIRRIFKNLDLDIKNKLSKLKKPRALNIFPDHVDLIQKYSRDEKNSVRVLTSSERIPAREMAASGIKLTLSNTETSLEFLAVLLSMLHDAGIGSLVLCVDEAEYIFSQMTGKKAALVFNSLRAMYDLPETPNSGLKLQPLSNIIFFFAISTSGMEKLLNMEKVEQHQGGPIQPLLTRVETKISLSRLSQDETKTFVEEYLKTSRTGEKLSSPLIPYNDDFIKYIYELTKGRPRSIIEGCDYVINEGLKDHIKMLTKAYAKSVYTRLNVLLN